MTDRQNAQNIHKTIAITSRVVYESPIRRSAPPLNTKVFKLDLASNE